MGAARVWGSGLGAVPPLGAVAVAVALAGCGAHEGEGVTVAADDAISPAPTRPRRDPALYEGNVARPRNLVGDDGATPARAFLRGDPVGLRLRGPLGSRVRYEVCVIGPRAVRRCLHGRTTGSDRFSVRPYPARRIGTYVARWVVAGRRVAAWTYEVQAKPRPRSERGRTETTPLRERYPELRLPRRAAPRRRGTTR